MEEFTFTNNAKEQFKFFINESGQIALNIRYEKELIACFILSDNELDNLKTFLNNVL